MSLGATEDEWFCSKDRNSPAQVKSQCSDVGCQKTLLVKGILILCFSARVESTCSADSRECHWATGRRGLDSMSAQWRSWFPVESQPRKIFPMASFLLSWSWSHTEITSCSFYRTNTAESGTGHIYIWRYGQPPQKYEHRCVCVCVYLGTHVRICLRWCSIPQMVRAWLTETLPRVTVWNVKTFQFI